jgi:hypothetical protein
MKKPMALFHATKNKSGRMCTYCRLASFPPTTCPARTATYPGQWLHANTHPVYSTICKTKQLISDQCKIEYSERSQGLR